MGRMPRRRAVQSGIAVIGLGLAACGGPSGASDPAAPGTVGRTTGAVVTSAAQASAGGTPAAEPRPAPTVPVRKGTTEADLGIELKGGTFLPVIRRGTAVPATAMENFTTDEDDQKVLKIAVYYGVSDTLVDARRIGGYELAVPTALPRGVPQLKVTFTVDAGGVVRLTAVDAATGAAVEVTEQG